MSSEILNVGKVRQLLAQRGYKQAWVIQQIGLKKTAGHLLMTNGLLPKDLEVKKEALHKLALILGVGVPEILLRLEAKETA